MSWPTEASFRNTSNSNVNDGEDVQSKIYLKQDIEFESAREAMANHMRNKAKNYCSCGPALFQRKYCSSDFVVIAKKSSVMPQRFYPDPDWEDFNYAGLAVPLVVQEVLRGSDALSDNIVVHFVQGSVCGVPPHVIPDGDGAYIVAAQMCEAKSVNRLHPTPRLLNEIPLELREKVRVSHASIMNDEQKFRNCLMNVGRSIPLYVTPRPRVTSAALSSRRNPYVYLWFLPLNLTWFLHLGVGISLQLFKSKSLILFIDLFVGLLECLLYATEETSGPQLADGFHLVGFSQGGLLVRALAQRCPPKRLGSVISPGGPQQGIDGLSFCFNVTAFPECGIPRRFLSKL
ncbi:hypothetical protein Aperf_G00000012443 [Anoplocephala perfoliata]